jgi:hypothetical protein
MSKGLLIGLAVLVAVGPAVANDLAGYGTPEPVNPPLEGPGVLYKGDLTPEMGLGCSNPTGNSGGPNDIAQGVTADIPAPFDIISHWYYIFTQNNTQGVELSFAWGQLTNWICKQPGLDFSLGSHTVQIVPPSKIYDFQFYFGQCQPQTNIGMRWGLDTNSGSAGQSYIRAPACGANNFTLLDNLGFPANWVMSVTVDKQPTPVELTTWGAVKAMYE